MKYVIEFILTMGFAVGVVALARLWCQQAGIELNPMGGFLVGGVSGGIATLALTQYRKGAPQ